VVFKRVVFGFLVVVLVVFGVGVMAVGFVVLKGMVRTIFGSFFMPTA
jgi:hypothetical protein